MYCQLSIYIEHVRHFDTVQYELLLHAAQNLDLKPKPFWCLCCKGITENRIWLSFVICVQFWITVNSLIIIRGIIVSCVIVNRGITVNSVIVNRGITVNSVNVIRGIMVIYLNVNRGITVICVIFIQLVWYFPDDYICEELERKLNPFQLSWSVQPESVHKLNYDLTKYMDGSVVFVQFSTKKDCLWMWKGSICFFIQSHLKPFCFYFFV